MTITIKFADPEEPGVPWELRALSFREGYIFWNSHKLEDLITFVEKSLGL